MARKLATVTSARVPATQTNFPIYIDQDRLGMTTLAEAQSGRWYTASDLVTEMAREVVSVTEGHGKHPSLTSTAQICIDWDGVRADYATTATYGRNAVWADYLAVYHGELSGSSVVDSTGNNTPTKQTVATPTVTSGKVGDALSPNSASWDTNINPNTAIGTGDFTWQSWNNFSPSTDRRIILSATRNDPFYNAFQMTVYESGIGSRENSNFLSARAGTSGSVETTGAAADGTWRMRHATRTGTTASHFINGVSVYSASDAEWGVSLGGTTSPIFILGGAYSSGIVSITEDEIDEIRVRGSVLSANWITTEYNNQNDEADFWGSWTTISTGPAKYLGMFSLVEKA